MDALFCLLTKRWIVMSDWLTIAILSVTDVVVLAAMATFTIAILF